MASAHGRVVRGAAPDHLLVLRRDASAAPVPWCFSCPPGLSRQAWVPVQISLFSFYVYAFELPEHGSVRRLLLSDGNLAFLSGIRVDLCLEVTGRSSGLNKAGLWFCSPGTRRWSRCCCPGFSISQTSASRRPRGSRSSPRGVLPRPQLPQLPPWGAAPPPEEPEEARRASRFERAPKQLSEPPAIALARLCPWLLLPARLTKKCSFCSWTSACLPHDPGSLLRTTTMAYLGRTSSSLCPGC